MNPDRVVGVWMTLGAALLFATSAVVAADVFATVSPPRVAQFRAVTAAVVLGAIALRRGAMRPSGNLGTLFLLGLNLAAVTVTFYWAIDRLGVGPGTTIQFTAPVLVLAWMRFREGRRVAGWAWGAAAAAVVGTALMTRAWDADVDGWGMLAGIGASVTFASYLVLGERLGGRLPALSVVAFGFFFSALVWLVAVPPRVGDLPGAALLQLTFIGVFGTAVPFLLEVSALRRVDPGTVGVVATAEPVFGAALAWVALDQVLTGGQVVGGVVTVMAVAGIHLVTRRAVTWPG